MEFKISHWKLPPEETVTIYVDLLPGNNIEYIETYERLTEDENKIDMPYCIGCWNIRYKTNGIN